MTRTRKHLIRTATLCMSLLPALALAHPGHGEELRFIAGALHPAGGVDQLAGLIIGLLFAGLVAAGRAATAAARRSRI